MRKQGYLSPHSLHSYTPLHSLDHSRSTSRCHYTPLARPQSVHNHYTVTPHRNVPLHTPARLNHKHETGSSTCDSPQQSTRISQRMGAAGFRQLRRSRPGPRWSGRQEFGAYIGGDVAHWCTSCAAHSVACPPPLNLLTHPHRVWCSLAAATSTASETSNGKLLIASRRTISRAVDHCQIQLQILY